jgi:hypothetical protein
MVMLDVDIAGCVDAWLVSRSRLDEQCRRWLQKSTPEVRGTFPNAGAGHGFYRLRERESGEGVQPLVVRALVRIIQHTGKTGRDH